MNKPRARKPNRSEYRDPNYRDLRNAVNYAFRIEGVRPSYAFQMVTVGEHDEALETCEYEIGTTCLSPPKLAGRKTTVRLLGKRNQIEAKFKLGAPAGLLTMRGKTSELLGWLPVDSLHWAMQHAIDGRTPYLTVIADPLRNGHANAHVISFEPDLEPEDFPGIADHG